MASYTQQWLPILNNGYHTQQWLSILDKGYLYSTMATCTQQGLMATYTQQRLPIFDNGYLYSTRAKGYLYSTMATYTPHGYLYSTMATYTQQGLKATYIRQWLPILNNGYLHFDFHKCANITFEFPATCAQTLGIHTCSCLIPCHNAFTLYCFTLYVHVNLGEIPFPYF